MGTLNTGGVYKFCDFSTIRPTWQYVGNDATQGHSYYGAVMGNPMHYIAL